MFPGGPGFAADYMLPEAEMFSDLLQSYLIDPHGSGGSTPPRDPVEYTPEGHAAFYEQVREALGLDDVVAFGHSFGAITGLAYCGLFPAAAGALVCVAGSAASGSEADDQWERALGRHSGSDWYPEARAVLDAWTERVLATRDATEIERMMTAVLPLYTAHPDRPEVARALKDMDRYLTADLACLKAWESGVYQSFDLRPLLARIDCPTLVVAGELDFICGPPSAQLIAESVRDATKVVIPDCGHIPVCESPELYREVVEGFLKSAT